MSEKRLIVVLGATGLQGGSVINTFIDLPEWRVRGITRDPSSAKANKLRERGVEMIAANLDDPDTLLPAFDGASAIFSNTDCWASLGDPEFQRRAKEANKTPLVYTYDAELQQGKNVFDAASKVDGLERLVFSSLSDASKWSKGKYKRVFHFDAKAHAVAYGKEVYPKLWAKTSVIQVGWYLNNWTTNPYMMPKKAEDGGLEFLIGVPAKQSFPFIAPEFDTGPFVLALVSDAPGKNLIAYRAYMSMNKLVETVTKLKGIQARCTEVRMDVNDPNEFLAGYAENMAYITEFGFDGKDETVIHPKDLDRKPALGTAAEWIGAADWSTVL